MSSTEEPRTAEGGSPDPGDDAIAAARARLADVEAELFADTAAVSPIGYADLTRRAVRSLFGHGR